MDADIPGHIQLPSERGIYYHLFPVDLPKFHLLQYSIVNEGAAFSYYETLESPGISSMTKIIEEQTIESISDSTSTFQ